MHIFHYTTRRVSFGTNSFLWESSITWSGISIHPLHKMTHVFLPFILWLCVLNANEGLWTIDGILFYVIIMMVIIDEASIIIKALVFMPNSGYEFEIIWWGGTGIGARQPHLLMGYEWHGVKHYGCQIIFWMCLISFWEWNLSSRSWVIIPRGARSFLLLLLRTLLASTYVF